MLCIFSVCDVTAVLSALTCSCHCSVVIAAFVMGTVASFAMMDLLGGGFEPEKDEGDVLEWYDGWKHWWPSRVWVASPLTRHSEVVCEAYGWGENHIQFNTSCPCCKRPLVLTIEDKASCDGTSELGSRCGFAVCVWGANAGYALGALVLGRRLQELSSHIDRILLHTDDVPLNYLDAFSCDDLWQLRQVDYVDGVAELYTEKGYIFDGVFTKISAWKQDDYHRLLLLDLDIIPFEPMHDLFDLDCPAAMVRASGDRLEHGAAVDGSWFFRGEDDWEWPWGQSGGVNAGVMLIEPNEDIYWQMYREVTCNGHPGHVQGSGPEQDYFSRFFAARSGCQWHHIDVVWNYQLHHVPFSLERLLAWYKSFQDAGQEMSPSDVSWRPVRMCCSGNIRNVHYSGDIKLWHMFLRTSATRDRRRSVKHEISAGVVDDKEFAKYLLSDQDSYSLWFSRTAPEDAYKRYACTRKGENIFVGEKDVTDVVDEMCELLLGVATAATTIWRKCAEALIRDRIGLLEDIQKPAVPPNRHLPGTCVEVCYEWSSGWEDWLEATVLSVHADGKYVVKYASKWSWGDTERRVDNGRVRLLV